MKAPIAQASVVAIESRSTQDSIVRFYRLNHERLLKVSEELTAEQFFWSAGLSLHSVAWQLWHSARWDDFFAAHLQADFSREPQTELWQREGLGPEMVVRARNTRTKRRRDRDGRRLGGKDALSRTS